MKGLVTPLEIMLTCFMRCLGVNQDKRILLMPQSSDEIQQRQQSQYTSEVLSES